MADYSVKGVGTITLPDGLSEKEIKSALDSHPDVVSYLEKKNQGRTALQTARGATGQFLQGIPFLKNHVQDLTAQYRGALGLGKHGSDIEAQLQAIKGADKSFKQDNPLTSFGLNVAGSMAAQAPLMPVLGAIAGPSTAANMLTQGVYGMGMGAADKADEEWHKGDLGSGDSNKRITQSGLLSGLFGTAGPILGKLVTPGHVATTNVNLDPAKRAGQELKGIVDEISSNVPKVSKPTNIEDQLAQVKDIVRGNDFGDLLAKHFPPYQPKPTNVQISPSQIEQAAARVAPQVENTSRNVFMPPTEQTKSAITHGMGAATGALLGSHDPYVATMAALLGHQVAPYAAQMGSALYKGVGGHPEKYWNNKFMYEHPGTQDILNLLAQGSGQNIAEGANR